MKAFWRGFIFGLVDYDRHIEPLLKCTPCPDCWDTGVRITFVTGEARAVTCVCQRNWFKSLRKKIR